MKMSLRTLLLWVAFIAVVTAALAQPSLFWMRVMLSLSIAFLLYAACGALAARGPARSFWIGAAVFGGGYFFMFAQGPQDRFNPVATSLLSRALITQPLLDALAAARGLEVRSHWGDFNLWDQSIYSSSPYGSSGMGGPGIPGTGSAPPGGGGFFDVDPEGLQESPAAGGPTPVPGASGFGENSDAGAAGSAGSMGPPSGMSPMPGGSSMGSPGPGSGMMPGSSGAPPMPGALTYASYNHFLITGHCAFVILVGLIGGTLCRWTFGREETAQERLESRNG